MTKSKFKNQVDGNELDLSLNDLTEIPVHELVNVPKATHLDMSCNKITIVPENFPLLTHLVKLDLSKNLIEELPYNFGNLIHLQFLDLYGNQLVILPVSFCRLKSLKWLDLKNNPLTPKLKSVAGDCLDPKQCQLCAVNVVKFMQNVDSELERQKQKKLKEEREKKAAEKAEEEKKLEAQRKLKKAEKEKRKAEARAKRAEMENQDGTQKQIYNTKLKSQDLSDSLSNSIETPSKSSSFCANFLKILMLIPVLFILSSVYLHTCHEIRFYELKHDVEIWWKAFASPYISSLKLNFQNWIDSSL